MKNFMLFAFFAVSTMITGTGIEKMKTEIMVFGFFLLILSVIVMLAASDEKQTK
jgi:hypothetical protein